MINVTIFILCSAEVTNFKHLNSTFVIVMMIDYKKVPIVLRSPPISILSMTLPQYLVVDCSAEVTTYAHPEYDLDLFDAAGLLSAKVCLKNSTVDA